MKKPLAETVEGAQEIIDLAIKKSMRIVLAADESIRTGKTVYLN